MSRLVSPILPEAKLPTRTPYVPPLTVISFAFDATCPEISNPASAGLLIVISSKFAAANAPPTETPVSAPFMTPLSKFGVPDSRTYSPRSAGLLPPRATISNRSW